jgi:AraC family transcriptional regulator
MIPRFELLSKKRLFGKSVVMSYSHNRTHELWRSFMVNRKMISKSIDSNLFSIQFYPPIFDWSKFSPSTIFEKWAACEVDDSAIVPEGFNEVVLQEGLYAVFSYKGSSNRGEEVFKSIFCDWLPSSEYSIDDRPHFEILGEKYIQGSDDSEEEIWIPVKLKS